MCSGSCFFQLTDWVALLRCEPQKWRYDLEAGNPKILEILGAVFLNVLPFGQSDGGSPSAIT